MLDPRVRAAPVQKAGPAHVATLKTFEPPLAALDGRQLAGARRRGKHLLFPTEDGELVLHIHLMSAGRLAFLEANGKQPKQPAFKLVLADGGALVLTERGSKKRARVGLYDPEAIETELAHLGPRHWASGRASCRRCWRPSRGVSTRFFATSARSPGSGVRGRTRSSNDARLSPYALSTELDTEEIERLSDAIDEELERGLALRERGLGDAKVYRVHDRLGEPCPQCGDPIARIDFEEHTIYYCPECQTSGRVLKDRRLSRLLR